MLQGPRSQLDWSIDPVDALARWPADRPVVMLHSGRTDARWSRWSVLAQPETGDGDVWRADGAPRAALHELEDRVAGGDGLWVGYLGYDLGREIEGVGVGPDDSGGSHAIRDHRWPDGLMHRCPGWLLHDRVENRWFACGAWAQRLPGELAGLPERQVSTSGFTGGPVASDMDPTVYLDKVECCLDYIAAGDVFQVNFTHRLGASFKGSTRALFAAMAQASPAWYGAFLEGVGLPGTNPIDSTPAIASISPELFFELNARGDVVTRPIKGTRPADAPRGVLENSAKDAAELAMIVDLLRNDLGRVCDYGTVRVVEPRTIERHPTVQHGVATVTGRLHPSRGLADLLRAVLPGGSITGAPKVRAMQVIDELEPVRRGPYCGAIGWLQGGTAEPAQGDKAESLGREVSGAFNIAIRTVVVDGGRATFGVGGGIVADSDPQAEYEETMTKAAAIRAALARGAAGSSGAAGDSATVRVCERP